MPGAVAEWTLQGSVPPATPAAPRIEYLSFSGCSVLVGVAVVVEVSSESFRNVKLRPSHFSQQPRLSTCRTQKAQTSVVCPSRDMRWVEPSCQAIRTVAMFASIRIGLVHIVAFPGNHANPILSTSLTNLGLLISRLPPCIRLGSCSSGT